MITDNKAPEYGQYIGGIDPYKVTDGNSIGEVYIYKNTGTDTGLTTTTGTTTLTS